MTQPENTAMWCDTHGRVSLSSREVMKQLFDPRPGAFQCPLCGREMRRLPEGETMTQPVDFSMTWAEFRHATAELQREFEAAFVRQFQDQFPGMTYAEMRKRVPQDVVNDLFAPYDDRWQQLFSEYRAVSRR